MDAVVDGVFKNAQEPQWLEEYVFGEFRAWQVIFLTITGLTTIIIALCCCIKFRIPRTKQQIEADYQRRVITKKFREKLERIQNSDMDSIDLKAALDLIKAEFDENEKDNHQSASLISSIASQAPSYDEKTNMIAKQNGETNKQPDKIRNVFSLSQKISLLVKKSKEKTEDTAEIC